MTMGAMVGTGSSAPGEPPGLVLARQRLPLSGAGDTPGLRCTSEKSARSGVTGQSGRSSYVTEKIGAPSACESASCSPALSNCPVYVPRTVTPGYLLAKAAAFRASTKN